MRSLEPKLVEREGFQVVGVAVRTTLEDAPSMASDPIARLWQRFFDENVGRRTPNAVPGLVASVYSEYEADHAGAYSVVLGPVVTSVQQVPDGLTHVIVPHGRYLAFPVEGMPPVAIVEAWSRIRDWFDEPRPIRRAFTHDIELYRPGTTEILVSIVESQLSGAGEESGS